MALAVARIGAAIALAAAAAGAFGAFFGRASAQAPPTCGSFGPFDFDTWEAEDYLGVYSRAIELAVAGQAITSLYTPTSGDPIDARYQGLEKGPRGSRAAAASWRVPPTIYKSIAVNESGRPWANGSSAVPYGGVGPILRSFDCGFGIGQVTSGMANSSGVPTAKQAAVGTHFLFNIAEGVRILADKWNSAPQVRPIAGTGDPAALEDWYYAIWSYNGFAFLNHPLNPNKNPLRGELYHCEDPAAPEYATGFQWGAYTYPEKIYGCMRYPPLNQGTRMWAAQTFDMPHMEREAVAKAFAPENFLDCDGFINGCPAMDYPTALPAEDVPDPACLEPTPTPTGTSDATPEPTASPTPCPTITLPAFGPHPDNTPAVNAALATAFIGNPVLTFNGPGSVSLQSNDPASWPTVTLGNAGTFIAPFRVVSSAPWLVVRHPGEPISRTLDGGVAIGAETQVVLQKSPRVAQAGYASTLTISLDVSKMPEGTSNGTLTFEPLLGPGGPYVVQVEATKPVSIPLPYRAFAPQISSK